MTKGAGGHREDGDDNDERACDKHARHQPDASDSDNRESTSDPDERGRLEAGVTPEPVQQLSRHDPDIQANTSSGSQHPMDEAHIPEGAPATGTPAETSATSPSVPQPLQDETPQNTVATSTTPSTNVNTPTNSNEPSREPTASTKRAASRYSKRRKPTFDAHTLSHFISTTRIPRLLDAIVARSLQHNTRLDHILIHGAPGSGTALLAHAVLRDFAPPRVIEVDAALGIESSQLRQLIERVGPRGVLFVHHIEALNPECDDLLVEAIAPRGHRGRPTRRVGPTDPSQSELDRAIAESASADRATAWSDAPEQKGTTRSQRSDFSLLATAHAVSNIGYLLRNQFDHMFHLRNDPKALRAALVRALRRCSGVAIDIAALPQLELVLRSLCDSAEPILRAIDVRADAEGLDRIDPHVMRSILEEDLAQRLPDEAYAASLRSHLGGRKIKRVTTEEVNRIASETGWGALASEGAIATMLREERRVQRP